MRKTTYTVTRFDVDDEFYVEVSPRTDNKGKEMYDFYLCKDDYGVKELMFGMYARGRILINEPFPLSLSPSSPHSSAGLPSK